MSANLPSDVVRHIQKLVLPEFKLVPRTYHFFATEGLPEEAGLAALSFANIPSPRRTDKQIQFPSRRGPLVYHSIKAGLQFFVEVEGHFYFGGTDDNPDDEPNVFLTEVTGGAAAAFHEGGEIDFFESLKPQEMKDLELEDLCTVARRQGDIFAVWSPLFGASAQEVLSMTLARPEKECPQVNFWLDRQMRFPVARTRHEVKGTRITVAAGDESRIQGNLPQIEYFFGEMWAPDHKMLNIGTKPHRLFQAANLVRPTTGGCGDR